MLKKIIIFAIIAFPLSAIACNQATKQVDGGRVIQVFYVPIGIETLRPITSEDIEKKGDRCLIDSEEEIKLIESIITSGRPPSAPDQQFTDKGVRVKLIERTKQGSVLLAIVEDEGFVKRADGHDLVLDSKNLAALKKLIEKHFK